MSVLPVAGAAGVLGGGVLGLVVTGAVAGAAGVAAARAAVAVLDVVEGLLDLLLGDLRPAVAALVGEALAHLSRGRLVLDEVPVGEHPERVRAARRRRRHLGVAVHREVLLVALGVQLVERREGLEP